VGLTEEKKSSYVNRPAGRRKEVPPRLEGEFELKERYIDGGRRTMGEERDGKGRFKQRKLTPT